jgi:hypothetical protein
MSNGDVAGAAAMPAPRPILTDALARVEQVLAVVETCLCETFPSDFFRRCAFTAYAARALLQDAEIDAVIVAGEFGAFVMTPDAQRLAIQGFKSGPERYPHIWVEAANRLIDLGPHLLAFGSDYPVASMPALAWDLDTPLPAAFRYKEVRRFPADSRISREQAIRAQCDAFIEQCRARAAAPGDPPRLSTWIATNTASLLAAVERRDPWANGAQRFEHMAKFQPLPF